jgi:drug/metabolite transporter (DMT)-like permease
VGLENAEKSPLLKHSRITADLILLGVAMIWGSAFVVQRIAAQEVGVLSFNGLRFLVGALVILPFVGSSAVRKRNDVDLYAYPREGMRGKSLGGILLAGIVLTCGATFQQAGLQGTTAGNAGFITGLYVVLIPIFLAIFWNRKPSLVIWMAAFLSVIGLFLLSTAGVMRINRGDTLVLISAVFWALHVIIVDRVVRRANVLHLAAGQYLVCGLTSLMMGLLVEPQGLRPVLENWWVVAYTGVLSVGLGYTLQAAGQLLAPPADAAIILSLEAVFAAISGWLFIDESLTPVQAAGCGIMLLGMLLAQSRVILSRNIGSENV